MLQHHQLTERVARYFVSGKYNCAMTVLEVSAEHFGISLSPQALGVAQFLPGAGGTGGLCGLISGTLMFLGVWAYEHDLHRSALTAEARALIVAIEGHFGSTLCTDLRPPEGCGTFALDYLNFTLPHLKRICR